MSINFRVFFHVSLALMLSAITLFTITQPAFAQDGPTQESTDDLTQEQKDAIALVETFTPQSGEIKLDAAYATLNLPEGYTFYSAGDTDKILTELWGNPPDQKALGSIFPPGTNPLTEDGYSIIISFNMSGYVKDEDAVKTNFDKLLKRMKKDTVAENKYRKQEGYPKIELLGWADEPRYDSENKRLVWAKKLLFEGSFGVTLNYNLRFLGRYGVLEFNYIADKKHLEDIKSAIPEESKMASFNQGSRYEDFNPSSDKVAQYGIAGLIAGGVLAKKLGLLAVILLFLKKGGVLIFAAFAFIIKPIQNFFNRDKDNGIG